MQEFPGSILVHDLPFLIDNIFGDSKNRVDEMASTVNKWES